MKIELAGYNVDTEILNRMNRSKEEILTPETFSAAYARISRSSDDITTLRKKARKDVARARKSNQTIIFEMGHHSVAEHAVFNLDIIGISRLALEEIERCRLASYTEKSQRYVTLKGDYVLPNEITDTRAKDEFQALIGIQNQFYTKAYAILRRHLLEKHPDRGNKKQDKRLLEGWAKEDARYILSLATEGQVGMTINARNIEHLLRRLRLSPSLEVREIGERIFSLIESVAPSIILFPKPSSFDHACQEEPLKYFHPHREQKTSYFSPQIVDHTRDGDNLILASLLSITQSIAYNRALGKIKKMTGSEKKSIFINLFKKMEFFDTPPRHFELPDLTFQAIISASNYAQLKRHRLATLISGDYQIELGNTIPENIRHNNLEKEFREIIDQTNRFHRKLKKQVGRAADYILTNSHRRMVIMKMNLREFYHFVRLRDDEHAQWDIKWLARAIAEEVERHMPLSSLLLCGKSDFIKKYEKIYKSRPKFNI